MPLEIRDLRFGYGGAPIFDGFSLSLADGEIAALLGPSGCGKTTLLKLIAGLLERERGSITFGPAGNALGVRGGEGQTPGGLEVSYVFQEPRLLPWRTLLENCAIPLERLMERPEARDRALAMLERVGLADKRRALPDEVSGGQRQRAALARAFAYPAPAILLDEPFQSQDLPLRIQLMDLTRELLASEPRIALAVTHDPREAIHLAERVLVISGNPVRVELDERPGIPLGARYYGSVACADLEERLFSALS